MYLNPGNAGFRAVRKGKYIDKTGLIHLINQTIDSSAKLTCISRPRRFGKSFAAKMLCAYYSRGCDSADLFKGLKIEKDEDFRQYL
ncbi:MAG: AAA family ATPase, partial [Eubacterium sp.]